MVTHRGLKAWQHARHLAIECARAARRLPRAEQPALAGELRRTGYAVALNIAAGATASGSARRASFAAAESALAQVDTILCLAHDLDYVGMKDFARLEAWTAETARLLYGLRRKAEGLAAPKAVRSTGKLP